jgi:flagellin-like hook-associated protein FlgL
MPLAISTNIAAAKANYYLGYNSDKMQESIKRLASGKKLTSPVQDPGNLAVSMKLSAAINRISGAMNNTQNAISFLEVQDGMLETVGKILDRMSELKGLSSQDPMKSEMDIFSYNNEFRDLQMQLYAMSNERFNGVSLFANYTSEGDAEVLFGDMVQDRNKDHTISIHTSQNGSGGAKVSLHKSMLKSALTVRMDRTNAGDESFRSLATDAEKNIGSWNTVIDKQTQEKAGTTQYTTGINKNNDEAWVTLAAPSLASTINLDDISVGVFIKTLENVSFLRAQNGGAGSRLNFAYENLAQQKTNMRAALGRMIDVDIAQESTNLATYNVLSQAAASMIAQANATSDLALILLR